SLGFRVQRNQVPTLLPLDEALSVNIGVVGGTAEEGVDYEHLPSSVTIEPGQTVSDVVYIVPVQDSLIESDETIFVSIEPGTLSRYRFGQFAANFNLADVQWTYEPPTGTVVTSESRTVDAVLRRNGVINTTVDLSAELIAALGGDVGDPSLFDVQRGVRQLTYAAGSGTPSGRQFTIRVRLALAPVFIQDVVIDVV
ncbi:MAG: Calx-beta domain-containing protein, partial [Phycisphaerae bacterium]